MPTSECRPISSRPEAPPLAARDERYWYGFGCVVLGALFTSTAGVLLRHVETAGGWQVLFYRSLALMAVLLVFLAWRHRGRTLEAFRAVGRPGLVTAVSLGAAFMLFIFALLETTVANVVFTISLTPFFTALFAWIAMREPVGGRTLSAMLVALLGVGFMLRDGLASGTFMGNLLALATCLCFSVALTALRKGRAVDMLPAVCLAGFVAATASGLAAGDLAIGRNDLALAITLGVAQLGLQYILVTTGMRHVPAAEAALIGRLGVVLGPLWVWLAVDEVPGRFTLIGGAIVLSALIGHGLLARRPARGLPVS